MTNRDRDRPAARGANPAPAETRRARPAGALLLAALALAPAAARGDVINRIILRVNDQIATLHDYQQRKRELIQEIGRREQDPAERRRLLDQVGLQVFRDMYDELLMQSRADQLGVVVPDEAVDREANRMRQAYGLTTDEEFRAALAQSGMTEAILRAQLRSNLRVREVLGREVNSKIVLEEDDLRRFYRTNVEQFRVPEQVDLREVVVLQEAVPDAGERARVADEIARAVAGGKKLEEAVEPFRAEGKTSGVSDLGRVSPGDLDPALEAAAWKLERGALSVPVAGRGGLHVLQVVERHASYVKPFNDVAAQIRQREEERLYREKVVQYMEQLRAQSLVVANPPPDAVGFEKLLGTGGRTTDEFNVGRATDGGQPTAGSAPAAAAGETAKDAQPAAEETTEEAPAAAEEVVPAEPGSPGALPEPKPVDPAPESEPVVPPPVQG